MKKFRFQTSLTDNGRYLVTVQIMLMSGAIRRASAFLFIPLVLFITFVTTSGTNDMSISTIWSLMPVLIFPILIVFILFILPYFMIKFGKKNNPSYEFDDWGMTLLDNDKTINIPWENLEAYLETGKYIFFKTTRSIMYSHFVQKNNLEEGHEIREFIDFLGKQRLKRR